MFDEILNTLFPKMCVNCTLISDNYLCDFCRESLTVYKSECIVCRKESHNWNIHHYCKRGIFLEKAYYFYKYSIVIESLMMKIKYGFHKDKIKELANLITLSEQFRLMDFSNIDLITYIPMTSRRETWRGFNQSEILARLISKNIKVPYLKILTKNRETTAQIELTRQNRLKNLHNAFSLRNNLPVDLTDKNILIIDDILTTGSTLNECAKVIRQKFPNSKIFGFCLARGAD